MKFEDGEEREYLECKRGCFNSKNQLHCLTGPAVWCPKSCENIHQNPEFWIDGVQFSKEKFDDKIEELARETSREIEQKMVRCYAWMIVQSFPDIKAHPKIQEFVDLEHKWVFDHELNYSEEIMENLQKALKALEELKNLRP